MKLLLERILERSTGDNQNILVPPVKGVHIKERSVRDFKFLSIIGLNSQQKRSNTRRCISYISTSLSFGVAVEVPVTHPGATVLE